MFDRREPGRAEGAFDAIRGRDFRICSFAAGRISSPGRWEAAFPP
jgi:hypothetical protein